MRSRVTALCLLSALLLSAGSAQASLELARSKYCMNCHGMGSGSIVGPGFRAIAARRAGAGVNPALVQQVATRIRAGSVGEWGQTPMPANALDAAEAVQLAEWILSLQN